MRAIILLVFSTLLFGCQRTEVMPTWSEYNVTTTIEWRNNFGMCIHNGKLFISGGRNATVNLNDLFVSEDYGVTWTQLHSSAPWGARSRHLMVSFGGKLWIIGGAGTSDIWSSSNDGVSWTQEAANTDFQIFGDKSLRDTAFVEAAGKYYMIGGAHNSSQLDDIFESSDGVTWTNVDDIVVDSIFMDHGDHIMLTLAGTHYLIGGYGDHIGQGKEVKSTSGPPNWDFTELIDNNPAGDKDVPVGGIKNSRMWISGQYDADSGYTNIPDWWSSADGSTWTKETDYRGPWDGNTYFDYKAAIFDNGVIVVAGVEETDWPNYKFKVYNVDIPVDPCKLIKNPQLIIDESNIIRGTLRELSTDEVVTRLVGEWRPNYFDTEAREVIFTNNLDKFGAFESRIDFYIFDNEDAVKDALAFWGKRLSDYWRMFEVDLHYEALPLEIFDNVIFQLANSDLVPMNTIGGIVSWRFSAQQNTISLLIHSALKVGTTDNSPDFWKIL